MGLLVNGQWQQDPPPRADGKFIRLESQYRNWIKADGSTDFQAESGRYHLYVSLACPWASRALIFRKLKSLENVISLSIVDPYMGQHGWAFSDGPDCIPDPLYQARYLHELYTKANPDYTGRVTVPVLWDKKHQTIVNNESADIIRMLNTEFNALTQNTLDFYPEKYRQEIDDINSSVLRYINNGVYKCGFATSQAAYEEAFQELFEHLDFLEKRLSQQRYLVRDQLTEADWRLFTTLIRFDAVYVGHFKCNKQRIFDYHHLHNYLLALYQMPGIAETVNMTHIKTHYYQSHVKINPTGIIPAGPTIDLFASHDR